MQAESNHVVKQNIYFISKLEEVIHYFSSLDIERKAAAVKEHLNAMGPQKKKHRKNSNTGILLLLNLKVLR